MTSAERFWSKVVITENPLDCWVWTSSGTGHGYGQVTANKKKHLSHRVSYEQVHGPIPAGLTIDHLCQNKACVNPSHLEAVTTRENNRRKHAIKTACNSGHTYNRDNTSFVN